MLEPNSETLVASDPRDSNPKKEKMWAVLGKDKQLLGWRISDHPYKTQFDYIAEGVGGSIYSSEVVYFVEVGSDVFYYAETGKKALEVLSTTTNNDKPKFISYWCLIKDHKSCKSHKCECECHQK